MKKIILAFIFIFSLSFFYGCIDKREELDNDFIAVQMEYLSNGQISQTFAIKTKIASNLADEEQITFSKNVCKGFEEKRNRFFNEKETIKEQFQFVHYDSRKNRKKQRN